jgi:hypothetical protein
MSKRPAKTTREGEPATIFLAGKDIHLAIIAVGFTEV